MIVIQFSHGAGHIQLRIILKDVIGYVNSMYIVQFEVGFELSGIDPYVAIAACLFRSLLYYCRTAGLLDYLVTGAEFLHFTETMFVNCGYITIYM